MGGSRAAAPIGDKGLAGWADIWASSWLAGPQAWLDGPEGGADGWTDGQKISPFYRTLSPIGAAALLPPMKTREVEHGKGTTDHLMPLGYLFPIFFGGGLYPALPP